MGCDDDRHNNDMCKREKKKIKKLLYLQTDMKIRIFFLTSDEQTIGSVYHCNL